MSDRSFRARYLALPALAVIGVVILSGSSFGDPPYHGFFAHAAVPVYAEDPDGVTCQRLIFSDPNTTDPDCVSPAERAQHQPGPAFSSRQAREEIKEIVCYRGNFTLIDMKDGRRGWAPSDAVTADVTLLPTTETQDVPPQCNAFTWS